MWYLSLSQLFYISDADGLFGDFFLSTKWENANTGQSLSSFVQSLPDMWVVFTYGENSMGVKRVKAPDYDVWERKLVKSESDTCDQHPLKTLQLYKLCDSVTEPSLPTSVRFFILFLRELCQFAFVCVQHNMHNMYTHKKSRLSCS